MLRACPAALRRPYLVVAQIHAIGNRSLVIILASGLAVGFVLALQMYYALVTYGAAESLGLIVNLSLTRELGPVVTALLFAGRAGTSLTAEIGLMKAGEQLAAMDMMAVDPKSRVLAPRFIGGIISMPILAVLFSAIGILGAYVVAVLLIGVDAGNFWSIMQSGVDVRRDIGNGVVKSIVFGLICTFVALYQGYEAEATPEGVAHAHDPHGRDLLARRAGDGLRPHRDDVLDALAAPTATAAAVINIAQNRNRPMGKKSVETLVGIFVLLGLRRPRLPGAEGGQPRQLQQRRRHLRADGATSTTSAASRCARRCAAPASRSAGSTAIKLDPKLYQGVVQLDDPARRRSSRRTRRLRILTSGLLGDQYVGVEPGAPTRCGPPATPSSRPNRRWCWKA